MHEDPNRFHVNRPDSPNDDLNHGQLTRTQKFIEYLNKVMLLNSIACISGYLAYHSLEKSAEVKSEPTPITEKINPETKKESLPLEKFDLNYVSFESQLLAAQKLFQICQPETATEYITEEHLENLNLKVSLEARSPQIALVQDILRSQGYFQEDNLTDFFGPITAQGILRFQHDYQLPATGEIDLVTMTALLLIDSNRTDNNNNPYLATLAWSLSEGLPSSGGGSCGAGTCEKLLNYPDSRVREIANREALAGTKSQFYQEGERYYPESSRDAYLIHRMLEDFCHNGLGWEKVLVKSFSDIPTGAVVCYPSEDGNFLRSGSGGTSKDVGHIGIWCKRKDADYELYDLKTDKPGGRYATRLRFEKLMEENNAYVYVFTGDRITEPADLLACGLIKSLQKSPLIAPVEITENIPKVAKGLSKSVSLLAEWESNDPATYHPESELFPSELTSWPDDLVLTSNGLLIPNPAVETKVNNLVVEEFTSETFASNQTNSESLSQKIISFFKQQLFREI